MEISNTKTSDELTHQFMSKDFQLLNNQIIKTKLTNNTGFTVVGVIGRRGVGKSVVLNQLALEDSPFPTETMSDVINLNNKTVGIDMHITKDRVILLDTMPILSFHHLALTVEKEKKIKVYTNDETENDSKIKMSYSPDILAVQLISYLFSICHVVLVVDQNLVNYRLLRLLDVAHRLRPWIDCNPSYLMFDDTKCGVLHSNLHDEFHDYCAQVLFIENNYQTQHQLGDRLNHISVLKECISKTLLSYKTRCSEQAVLRSWLQELKVQWKQKEINRLRRRLQRRQDNTNANSTNVIQLETGLDDGFSDEVEVEPESPIVAGNNENLVNDSPELDNNYPQAVEVEEDAAEEDMANNKITDNYNRNVLNDIIENRLHLSISRNMEIFHVPMVTNVEELKNTEVSGLLQQKVFGFPRKHFSATQNERFSELCWLEHATNMWSLIRESILIRDYFFSLSSSLSSEL